MPVSALSAPDRRGPMLCKLLAGAGAGVVSRLYCNQYTTPICYHRIIHHHPTLLTQ